MVSWEGQPLPRSFDSVFYGAAGTSTGGPPDDEFNRVSFLSHFEGANNGVNNAFDDSSASNHTITANGNVTQGSFGPYGTNWSVDFDGDDYFTVPQDADFNVDDGSYTMECFVNTTFSGYQNIIACWDGATSGNPGWGMFISSGNQFGMFVGTTEVGKAGAVVNDGAWHHLAGVFTNSGATVTLYVDGAQISTGSVTAPSDNAASIIRIGSAGNASATSLYTGKISNLRLVKGTAVYSGSSFTVPTSALTAITNTKLLVLGRNNFSDGSASGHVLTPISDPTVTAFGPILTSAVYDAAVNGASAYFDGNGDYLSAPQIISQSGNFTIEGWVYTTSTDASQVVCGGEAGPLRMIIDSSGGNIGYFQDNVGTYTGSSKESLNQWCHFVAMRTGSNQAFYVNGTRVFNETAANMYEGNFYIGNTLALSYYHFGYISNIRCTASAVYSEGTSITVPTAPYSTVTNTNLLLNMADGQAIDSAAQNNLSLGGTANISTDQAKFGNTSLHLAGSNRGDHTVDIIDPKTIGKADFTIEGFYRFVSFNNQQNLFDFRTAGNSALPMLYFNNGSNELIYYVSAGARITYSIDFAADTWYHVALCRSGTSTKLFVDGTQGGSTYSDSTSYVSTPNCRIGSTSYNDGSVPLNGFCDDFRISHMARYTSNFTVPDAAFPDKGQ